MSGTLLDTTENRYDALPYHLKDFAGLPMRFYDLPHEMQDIFETLLESEYKTKKQLDIEEELGYIVDITNEASSMAAALVEKYSDKRSK